MKKLLYTFTFLFTFLWGSNLNAQMQTPLDNAMRFVEQNADKWGLDDSDYKNVLVSDMYTNKKTGITYIYLMQEHQTIPIHNAITPIMINPEGKIFNVRHNFIPFAAEKVNTKNASITPKAAIKAAVSELGILAEDMPTLLRTEAENHTYVFSKPSFAENEIEVKKRYLNVEGELKLVWNLAINEVEDEDFYNLFVDATSGEVVSKFNNTIKCTIHKDRYAKHVGCDHDIKSNKNISTFAKASEAMTAAATGGTYNVFPLPVESPIYGDRELVVAPFFPDASPFGWHDTDGVDGAEFTITRGNNVHAYLDKTNVNSSSGDEPDGGEDLIFDFDYDVINEATDNEQAAVVNLFYTVNMAHDITKRLGFDEPAGNFQANNYGNGGADGDYVDAEAFDGSEAATPTFNNAFFSIVPDGQRGQIGMFLWDNPSGLLSIDEPEEIAGFIPDVIEARNPQTGAITWGTETPGENDTPITGKVVLAIQDAPGDPTTACGPIRNVEEVAGNIALVDRGLCDFSLKAYNAQQAGAISVIICNIDGGSALGGMGGGQNAEDVLITPLLVPKEDCDRIKASILSDIDVILTLQNRGPDGPTYLDGSMDNGIIVHEYGHGVSSRLIGGPGNASCLSTGEQAGEGISDYLTLITTVEEGDVGETPRGIGNYAVAQNTGGDGIRTFPYSTDMSVNPLTYDDIKSRGGSVHGIGEIWTTALWEVFWAFVEQDGLDISWENEESGNFKAARLAIEGMKLAPCDPSIVDLRDGVLAADSLLYDGANGKLLWIAFAKRGLGYLADDGGDSNDVTDGTESFEPWPLVIEELKISASVRDAVTPGEELTVDLKAINHIPETQNNVTITVNFPEGMSYIDGSSTMPATFENNQLVISLGEMEYLAEMELSYGVKTSEEVETQTLFYDNVDDANTNDYEFGVTEGFNLWLQSFDVANSEFASWYASQINPDEETDFFMTIPTIDVVGERPVLKFAHRFDTEAGFDGGFLQISTDGEIFTDVKGKFIRNGYNTNIQYQTFAIPLLEAFGGTTNEEWIYSYLDLSDYKGETVYVRFRFGTDAAEGVEAAFPGWFVDDLEVIDLETYESVACINSDNSGIDRCSEPIEIFVESDQILDTSVEELEGFDISVAPNPASEYVSVGISAEKNTPIQLLMTSIDGKIVQTTNMVVGTNQSVRTFNTSNLEKGMYLIQIKSADGLVTKKVIIQ